LLSFPFDDPFLFPSFFPIVVSENQSEKNFFNGEAQPGPSEIETSLFFLYFFPSFFSPSLVFFAPSGDDCPPFLFVAI